MAFLNHAAAYVRDLQQTRDFYQRYFGARADDGYHNPRTGLRTHFLSFDGDARLEIMTRPDVDTTATEPRLGWIHLAISVGSSEAVDELTSRLRRDGFTVVSGPRTTGDGYYESCVLDPEGNQVEIVA